MSIQYQERLSHDLPVSDSLPSLKHLSKASVFTLGAQLTRLSEQRKSSNLDLLRMLTVEMTSYMALFGMSWAVDKLAQFIWSPSLGLL